MPSKSIFWPLVAALALISAVDATAFKISDNKNGTFGIYELVDCNIAGARPKLMKAGTGAVAYCVAPTAIVDQKQLKWAEAATNEAGTPYLALQLNKEGGRIMTAASQRLLDEQKNIGKEAQVAIVINGKVLAIAKLQRAIKDQVFIEGGHTKRELERLAQSLNNKGKGHLAGEDSGNFNQ